MGCQTREFLVYLVTCIFGIEPYLTSFCLVTFECLKMKFTCYYILENILNGAFCISKDNFAISFTYVLIIIHNNKTTTSLFPFQNETYLLVVLF